MIALYDSPRHAAGASQAARAARSTHRAWRSLVPAAALLLALGAEPVAAQDLDSLANQLEQLQREMSELQRTVYNGAPPPAGTAAGAGNLDASQEVRIQQLQEQMSGLTGQVEELGYQMTRLQERIDRLAEAVGSIMHGEAPAGAAMAGTTAGAAPGAEPAPATVGSPPPPASTPGTLGTLSQSQLDAAQSGAAAPGEAAPQPLTPPADAGQTAALPAGPYELPGATPDEQYQYAFGLLRQANYPEAERALQTFIERHPTSPLAGNAQYWLGETYYVRGDYQNAAVAFADGYQKYPNSGKAPDNLLKLGMSLGEIGATSDACTALSQLDKQFPAAPANIKERALRERQRLGC